MPSLGSGEKLGGSRASRIDRLLLLLPGRPRPLRGGIATSEFH